MIVIDANVLIAALNPHEARHEDAVAILANSSSLLIHPINLAEVLVPAARAGKGTELLADLGALGVAAADTADGEPLRLASLRARTRLKLPDCCALDVAMVKGLPLATFDAALRASAEEAAIVAIPARAERSPLSAPVTENLPPALAWWAVSNDVDCRAGAV